MPVASAAPARNARHKTARRRVVPRPVPPPAAPNKIVVPVHYSAWLGGDLGDAVTRIWEHALEDMPELVITRLPRALVVEAQEEAGPLVEAVMRAAHDVERDLARVYPVFHHQFGPLWTGTLQCVFAEA